MSMDESDSFRNFELHYYDMVEQRAVSAGVVGGGLLEKRYHSS
jgi:hypothetical protein